MTDTVTGPVNRFYVTTPIYYVNAEPHLGHAYTTIIGDALTRWHRLLGDDVKFLTGTDEHGLKIQQAAEAAGLSPQEFTDSIAPKFVEAWKRLNIANDDFIRTTEPRHKAAVAEILQRCYDAGDIELDVFQGLYCVPCELYYAEDELIQRRANLCPIHQRPVEYFEEENYFFRLSRFEDRLLDWYAKHPTAMKPEHRGNEALGLIRGGLRDFSISRTSLQWGIPLPWDPAHVTYVWFDALTNYLAAVGFGDGTERLRGLVARRLPPDRQGHRPPALRVLAGDADVGGHRSAEGLGDRRLAAERRREDEQDVGQRGEPARPDRRGRPRRLPLLRARRHRLRQRRRLHLRGPGHPVQLRPRQQPRQPARPRGHRRRQEVRWHRPACRSDEPARGRRCDRLRRHRRGMGHRPAEPRPRRHVAADPGDQRLPRGERTVEGRARPGGRRGDGRRARSAAHRGDPLAPAMPDTRPGGVGTHRPDRPGRRPTPTRGRGMGQYPGGVAVTKGDALFPRLTV